MLTFKVQSEVIFRHDEMLMDIHADFFDGKEKVHEVNYSYPKGVSEEEILSDLKKAAELYESEREQSKQQAKVDEIVEHSKSVSENLSGKEFALENGSITEISHKES